jgi:pyridoxine 4-dehydrogenase
VQNFYNIAHREDDAFIDELARRGVAYVPFFPLGGFSPLQSSELDELIPGTSSVKHLRENLQAARLQLSSETIMKLDSIAAGV